MNTRTISHTLNINATPERVWEILTVDAYVRQWYVAFCEGTYAQTDWTEGSKALFIDASGDGMAGIIKESKANERLYIAYTGMVSKFVEDYSSESAQKLVGGYEGYTLREVDGKTQLDISAGGDMVDKMFNYMEQSWQAAVTIIIRLAENQ